MRMYTQIFLSGYPILTSNADVTVSYRTYIQGKFLRVSVTLPSLFYPKDPHNSMRVFLTIFPTIPWSLCFLSYPSHVPPFSKNIFFKTGGGSIEPGECRVPLFIIQPDWFCQVTPRFRCFCFTELDGSCCLIYRFDFSLISRLYRVV